MNGYGRDEGRGQGGRSKVAVMTRETVGMTLLLFSAVVFFICVTGSYLFGEIGVAITAFFLGIFGFLTYPLLLAAIYHSVVLVFGKGQVSLSWKLRIAFLLVSVFLIVHTATAERFYGDGYGSYLSGCWNAAKEKASASTGGGVILGLVAFPVRALLSSAGAYVVFIAMMLIAAILILFKTPLGKHVKGARVFGGRKIEIGKGLMKEDEEAEKNAAVEFDDLAPPARHMPPKEEPKKQELPQRATFIQPGKQKSALTPEQNKSREILFDVNPMEHYRNNLIFSRDSYFNSKERVSSMYQQGAAAKPKEPPRERPDTNSYAREDKPQQYAPQYNRQPVQNRDSYSSRYASQAEIAREPMPRRVSGETPAAASGYTYSPVDDISYMQTPSYRAEPQRNESANRNYYEHDVPYNEAFSAIPDMKKHEDYATPAPEENTYNPNEGNAEEDIFSRLARESTGVREEPSQKIDYNDPSSIRSLFSRPAGQSAEDKQEPDRQIDYNDPSSIRSLFSRPVGETRAEFPRTEERTFARDNDRTFGREEERTFNRDTDRTFGREEERTFNRDTDRTFGREEERTFARDNDRNFGREEERTFDRDNDRTFGREEERTFDRDNDRTFGREEERTFDRDNDRTFGREEERTFARDNDRSFGREEERAFDRDNDRSFGREEERTFDRDDNRSFGREEERTFARDNDRTLGGEDERSFSRTEERTFAREEEQDFAREERSFTRGEERTYVQEERGAANLFDDDDNYMNDDYAEEEPAPREPAPSRIYTPRAREREASIAPPSAEAAPAPVPKRHIYRQYIAPSYALFKDYNDMVMVPQEEIEKNSTAIEETLAGFRIDAKVVKVTCGCTVTRYDLEIPGNISVNTVVKRDEEIAMRLHASDGVNVYANRANGTVSVDVPNTSPATVGLRSLLYANEFVNSKPGSLMFVIGKDVEGKPVIGNIVKMKHLLVAGTTGSGKSVCLHSMLISLICKYSPEDLRLILIDPKNEFTIYEGLPHLMINEIISDAQKAVTALNWAIKEMERRYALFQQKTRSGILARNIDEYNLNLTPDEQKLSKIVIIVDELADLMSVAKKDIEERIQRLTQKSRAAGIHLVISTQRPSVDVITGVIKGNLPTRMALRVIQEVDSRTIIDETGAQKLLGNGDMLFRTEGMFSCMRVQGAFLSSKEVEQVVANVKANNEAYFDPEVADYIDNPGQSSGGAASGDDGEGDEVNEQYIKALGIVVKLGSASISLIQRKCSVGYNHAGKIIEWMELMGYISPFDGKAKARTVLLTKEEYESKYGSLD